MLRQQSNEEEEGQRKLGLTFQKKKQSTRRSPRTKEQIDEDKNKPKIRKKKKLQPIVYTKKMDVMKLEDTRIERNMKNFIEIIGEKSSYWLDLSIL